MQTPGIGAIAANVTIVRKDAFVFTRKVVP